MCFGSDQPLSQSKAKQTPTSTTDVMNGDAALKRILFGGTIGGIGDPAQKVREAGLGTSITPKPIGSVVKDPTRQS